MGDGLTLDRWEVMGQRLQPWFAAEMAELYGTPAVKGDGVLMGCPVWGKDYIERFTLYSLPSIGSPKNLAALRGRCRIVLFIEPQAMPVMFRLTEWLRHSGIEFVFRTIPDWVIDMAREFESQFVVLGCSQNILAHMAGRAGMGFHMLMPDHVYAEGYFANLMRLARKHNAIAQSGVSTRIETAAEVLEQYRDDKGYALAIPDRVLGDISIDHMHPESRMHVVHADSFPNAIPKCHKLLWKQKDALRIHSCHVNPAWLGPELTKKAPVAFTSTMDTMLPEYVPPEAGFYVPTIDDGMAFIEISTDRKPVLSKRVGEGEFAEWVLCQTSFTDDYWPYFNRPSLIPCTRREDGATNELVETQLKQVHTILDKHRPALMAKFLQQRLGNRFDRERSLVSGRAA